jgi:hypothetical protein
MFGQLAQSLRSGGQRVASLRSKDCKMKLKPIIKSLVVQLIGTNSMISLKEGKVNHSSSLSLSLTLHVGSSETSLSYTSIVLTVSSQP